MAGVCPIASRQASTRAQKPFPRLAKAKSKRQKKKSPDPKDLDLILQCLKVRVAGHQRYYVVRRKSANFLIFRLAALGAKVYKFPQNALMKKQIYDGTPKTASPGAVMDGRSCQMIFNPLNLFIVMVIIIIPIIPTLWAIVDLPRRRFSSIKSKAIWFAVVSTLPCVGAVLYFLLVRRNTQPL